MTDELTRAEDKATRNYTHEVIPEHPGFSDHGTEAATIRDNVMEPDPSAPPQFCVRG